MTIEPATARDVRHVVSVHQYAFPEHFLTRLGAAFLRRYYQLILEYDHGILLVARSPQGQLQGFVSGFCRPHEFYARMKSKKISFALRAVPALLRSPGLTRRLLTNRQRVEQSATTEENQDHLAELSSLAVDPQCQGRGLGKSLVLQFEHHAAANNATEVYLTTDANDNDAVIQFYERLEYARQPCPEAPEDRPMFKYTKSCLETQV